MLDELKELIQEIERDERKEMAKDMIGWLSLGVIVFGLALIGG